LEIKPGQTPIGWIGVGVMGASMAGHLLEAGYSVSCFNRSRSPRLDALVLRGAQALDSPRAVAEASDVVFVMVGYPSDVRQVVLSSEGVLTGARTGSIVCDMTTSQPSLAVEMAAEGRGRGVSVVDAPVSGGDVGAREARLSIMVGGEDDAVGSLQPLFGLMGKTVVHQGPPGSGQHAKMVNQILIASNMMGVCEALLYAHAAGLDLDRTLQSVSTGAAGSWSLSNLAPRILQGDFEPGFFVEHFLKDMAIALDESRRMKLALPSLALAEQLYRAVAAQGYARKGTQALALALARLNGLDGPPRRA
jgi:3-hydroxyisobutyrate dehydrogenase